MRHCTGQQAFDIQELQRRTFLGPSPAGSLSGPRQAPVAARLPLSHTGDGIGVQCQQYLVSNCVYRRSMRCGEYGLPLITCLPLEEQRVKHLVGLVTWQFVGPPTCSRSIGLLPTHAVSRSFCQ